MPGLHMVADQARALVHHFGVLVGFEGRTVKALRLAGGSWRMMTRPRRGLSFPASKKSGSSLQTGCGSGLVCC